MKNLLAVAFVLFSVFALTSVSYAERGGNGKRADVNNPNAHGGNPNANENACKSNCGDDDWTDPPDYEYQ